MRSNANLSTASGFNFTLTTQGYSGVQRWVGSVTERVLDTSRLPLLIVRPRE